MQDIDGDGFLTANELQQGLQDIGEIMSEQEVKVSTILARYISNESLVDLTHKKRANLMSLVHLVGCCQVFLRYGTIQCEVSRSAKRSEQMLCKGAQQASCVKDGDKSSSPDLLK